MDYILSGDAREIAKVIRENRIRIERGVIKFTPACAAAADSKRIVSNDVKDVPAADSKETMPAAKTPKRTKKS